MIAELALPRLGETMESGRVVAWLKQPGERFRRGETLVEIESDKTVVEMPALMDGTLVEILVQAGQDADVGAPLCRYDDGGPSQAVAPPAGVRATPAARAEARRGDVALAEVTGTGRRGRIEAADVRAASNRAEPAASGSREVSVGGGRIAYRSWGAERTDATSLVLLHGLAGDAQTWAGLASQLARDGACVLAPDLPGHGATTVAAETFSAAVESTAAFLRAVAQRPVHLVGHSLGGAVAVRVAHAAPDLVAAVTLIAPAGLDRAIDVEFVRDVVRVRGGGALVHLLRRLSVRPAGLSSAQLDAMAGELGRGRLLALADALADAGGQALDIISDLRALAMPVRVLWGLQDRIIPWTQVGAAGSRAAIHLIADAGHVPHWDQPAEVAALLA